ncbi:MAG: putative glycoside hydrolase [Lachnospiraceae bacterium]|nr:putative glycoside hydrolase [Lachnospiraceae bacterium]
MENIFYEGIRTKRRRRKKGPVILLLLLAAVLIGFGGYKISQKLLTDEEDEKDPGSEVLVVDNMIEAASWDAADANSDGSDPDSGVYKLWTEPKPTEAVVTQTPDYDEEVWMADFVDTRERVDAKGIYVSSAYINKKLNDAIDLIDSTELNAIVIDIKSDGGYITYRMDHPLAKEIGACTSTIGDINATIKKLKDHGIYTIARIVSLKDPVLAEKRKDLALKNKDGSIFRDSSGLAWVNPYEDEVWEYLLEICKQCVAVGFDEVNLDYIRFATDKGMANVDFGPKAEEMTRIEVITEGIKKICEVIKPMGAFVSCDVYGAIISSSTDARIVGQSYFNMAKYLDYICPMVYPSHYGNGYYGLDYPDTHPYELVYHALMDSQKVLYMIDPAENKAIVRPWLQDFTATWVSHHLNYGKEEVRAQIKGVYDAGYSEWLLWNAGVSYTADALEKK